MRWTAFSGSTLIHDSGVITGAAEPQLTLGGLLPGTECTVKLEIQTEAGAKAEASADFTVSYPLSPERGSVIAVCRDGLGCIEISWTRFAAASSYSVLRREDEAESLEKVGDCPADVGSLRDYAVLSGKTYTYYVFPSSPYAYLTLPLVSESVKAKLSSFRLIEARDDGTGVFVPRSVHLFTCSKGDPMPGGIGNNSTPAVHPGISKYPVRLSPLSNYASGVLNGYVSSSLVCPAGQRPLPLRLQLPPEEPSVLILATPAGERFLVSTAGPVIEQTDFKTARMPVSVRIPWVETGPAPTAVTARISSGFLPVDGIILSSFTVDLETGMLLEETELLPHPSDIASRISISEEGCLIVTPPTAVPPAVLYLDDYCCLTAETPDSC